MKRLSLIILLGLLAGIAGNLLIDRYCIPDLVFFRRCAEVSDAWAEQLRQQQRPCVVLAGGSEIRTGVDPAVMLEEFDLPVINAAEHAGFSLRCNLVAALPYLRRGDTLVLSDIGVGGLQAAATTLGLKFCFIRRGFGFFSPELVPLNAHNLSAILLGNVAPLTSHVTRSIFLPREQTYRYYSRTSIHPSGWMEVGHRFMTHARFSEKAEQYRHVSSLGEDTLKVYREVQARCREMGVDFVVHVPVSFSLPEKRPHMAFRILQLTQAGIPVLRDERLGAVTDNAYFADTDLHPTAEGTKDNSRILARLLQERRVWTEAELLPILREAWWQGTLVLPESAVKP